MCQNDLVQLFSDLAVYAEGGDFWFGVAVEVDGFVEAPQGIWGVGNFQSGGIPGRDGLFIPFYFGAIAGGRGVQYD